jgi:transposase
MPKTPLFPLPEGLEITSVSDTTEEVVVRVTSYRATSVCPLCSVPSSAIHSYYRRKPLDLPCVGRPIRLLLTVKKFFCREMSCPRKIFTERLADLIEVSSRLTKRLRSAVQEIGFATCGKGGERLSSKLGIRISDTTLLWSLFLVPVLSSATVEVIGIDDWAWRKGQRYGSIIVDLQSHKILDLLPERTTESVIAWLEAHKEVEVVSRDRGGTYVDGATQGAPLAVQVADRWHLMKNMGDAVEAYLIRARVRIPEAPPPISAPEEEAKPEVAEMTPSTLSHRAELSQQRLLQRQEICQQAKDLREKGWSIHAIAKHLNRERATIRKYLKVEGDWQRTPRPPGKSLLDPYRESILAQWEQGCRNGQHILRTIRTQGYKGSDTLLRAFVTDLRKQLPVKAPARMQACATIRTIAKTPREIRWLLAKHREDLTDEERADLDRLLQASEEVRAIRSLLHKFLNMVRQRKDERLRPWMEAALTSDIPELKSFVAGIERDYDAVKAALRLPWSQGITEGKVNKLKTLKRVMYGKAGFALLRQRLLHDA